MDTVFTVAVALSGVAGVLCVAFLCSCVVECGLAYHADD